MHWSPPTHPPLHNSYGIPTCISFVGLSSGKNHDGKTGNDFALFLIPGFLSSQLSSSSLFPLSFFFFFSPFFPYYSKKMEKTNSTEYLSLSLPTCESEGDFPWRSDDLVSHTWKAIYSPCSSGREGEGAS